VTYTYSRIIYTPDKHTLFKFKFIKIIYQKALAAITKLSIQF